VIGSSELNGISPVVIAVMEIEYKLQIKFANGILYSGNLNYFTESNIDYFERLILGLPEFPESVKLLRERYLNIELLRIRQALERHNNPSENNLRALENLRDMFIMN